MNTSTYLPPAKSNGSFLHACKSAVLTAYKRSGAMRLHEAIRAGFASPHVTVFLFHRVTDVIAPDGLTVGTRWFRDFCGLMKAEYRVVPLSEIVRIVRTGERPARRTVAITFDDSYEDNHAAARVLHEHGLLATFFVPTKFVGTDLRYFWDAHLPPLPNLSWDQVREMAAWGHDIGSHSVSHPDFGTLDADAALKELVDSRSTIEAEVGRAPEWFAYPFGGPNNMRPEQIDLIARAGYRGSFSAIRGFLDPGRSYDVMPRQAVSYFGNLAHLELHVNRCLDWLYRIKRKAGVIPQEASYPSR